ncbi:MAG TPA: TIGR00730 family Rossman fold protein [bacterium]|nr:TIGR00730 family Rossman fold protein [bacterium]
MTAVCVYCSSSRSVDGAFVRAARALGAEIARRGWTLVYGGTRLGLMGAVATAAQQAGGRVVGVVPQVFVDQQFADKQADELVVAPDLRARKEQMLARADALVALPGGFGTLDELLEAITLKQIRQHDKAIVVINTDGYYDPLLAQLERVFAGRFTHPAYRACYHVAADAAGAGAYLAGYQPPRFTDQWL